MTLICRCKEEDCVLYTWCHRETLEGFFNSFLRISFIFYAQCHIVNNASYILLFLVKTAEYYKRFRR